MSKLGQKETVINTIISIKPSFQKGVDNALLVLSSTELESVKSIVTALIVGGTVEYSKDITNLSEVRSYARSMVMNHIKKAKELNGGHAYVAASVNGQNKTVRVKVATGPKGIDVSLLSEGLQEYVKSNLT